MELKKLFLKYTRNKNNCNRQLISYRNENTFPIQKESTLQQLSIFQIALFTSKSFLLDLSKT